MNVQTLFQNFNPSKFIIHTSLMVFTIFFSLRLDGTILWSYWAVFSPIWFWKFMVIFGAAVGSYVWWRYPHFRLEGEAYIHYKAMLITLALHLILLMFELLACDKLQSGRHLWILVFIPLIFISVVSIAVCVWAVKHDRSFELELFCSVNMLQFIFLALRLDKFTTWSWEVVFVPLWIVMCLSLVSVLYTIIFAGILIKTPEVNSRQRRTSFNAALGYTLLVVPILVFQVLLTNKLDEDISMSFFGVCSPLLISFTTLIIMSFNSKGGNKWWFGLRKDFCQFLLGICPFLQEYANIAYNSQINLGDSRTPSTQPQSETEDPVITNLSHKTKCKSGKNVQINETALKPVAQIISIDMPD
ncbi:transmembrane protein 185B [Planococcus citri]|uniref:transmembrane protein 185B n=1 Tax=Planococcus citri TaxID=170843 RepID=UPI0031F7C812